MGQFLCMAFAQLTYRESLRDIESCLRAAGPDDCHILQVLSVTIFEKTPILQAFCDWDYTNGNTTFCNQL